MRTKKAVSPFAAGDSIVTPHGLGTFIGVSKVDGRDICSIDGPRARFQVPLANLEASGFRPVMDADTAERLLQVLTAGQHDSRPWRERFVPILRAGDDALPALAADFYATLGPPSQRMAGELDMVFHLREKLLDELAAALGKSVAEVELPLLKPCAFTQGERGAW